MSPLKELEVEHSKNRNTWTNQKSDFVLLNRFCSIKQGKLMAGKLPFHYKKGHVAIYKSGHIEHNFPLSDQGLSSKTGYIF